MGLFKIINKVIEVLYRLNLLLKIKIYPVHYPLYRWLRPQSGGPCAIQLELGGLVFCRITFLDFWCSSHGVPVYTHHLCKGYCYTRTSI